MSALFFGSAYKEAGEVRGWHVALALLLFAGGGLLFSWLFPYMYRAEVHLREDGIRWVIGKAGRGKFLPYEQIERCSFSQGRGVSYTLMDVRMRGGFENLHPGPVYQTGIPARVSAARVGGILREAKVAVDNHAEV